MTSPLSILGPLAAAPYAAPRLRTAGKCVTSALTVAKLDSAHSSNIATLDLSVEFRRLLAMIMRGDVTLRLPIFVDSETVYKRPLHMHGHIFVFSVHVPSQLLNGHTTS